MRRVTARQLIEMVESVDLRGRGGAAFPFARKVRAVVDNAAARKCKPMILINGTEGEPGSAKDKMLLLRSPYLVLGGALLAARALSAKMIIIGVTDSSVAASVAEAARAEPDLKKIVRVVEVPDRFVSGEGGALTNAVNGKIALPPGKKRRAAESGVDGLPTLLSNAETFAQLAVLAMLGQEGYASDGTPDEPGTVLLTVGGSAGRRPWWKSPPGSRWAWCWTSARRPPSMACWSAAITGCGCPPSSPMTCRSPGPAWTRRGAPSGPAS